MPEELEPQELGLEEVEIQTQEIALGAFLKFANAAESGGRVKGLIQSGQVQVNGQVVTQRGMKLHEGDVVAVSGKSYRVISRAGA